MNPGSSPFRTAAFFLLVARLAAGAADGPPGSPTPTPTPRPIDFVADIQPIFVRHCLECHGPERQKSGYRLDVKAAALKGGDSGQAAIVPGQGAASLLVRLVAGEVPDLRMPPKGDPPKPEEIALLRAWIDQGAAWPDSASAKLADPRDWWSLKPLVRPPLPTTAGEQASDSITPHPVDAFVRSRLADEDLRPAPEADRRTLIRRITFDLIGLPPTPEEVAAFVADPDPRAYERLVDRLLASPRYGERWARHWLDVVHYGDTHGYDKDKPRPNAWPYRDYVIRAFNEDKPYGRFVQEQIAGDHLFPNTADGIEALGFVASGPWDFIGHEELPETKTDGKIARHLDRDDMVSNTIGTFASLTVHCSQCHDHKFDPIPQEDYYRLQAVFAAVDRTDRRYDRDPESNRLRTERERRSRALARRERELKDAVTREGGAELADLDRRIGEAERSAKSVQPEEYGWHSQVASEPDTLAWVQVDLGRTVALDRVVLAPGRDSFNDIGDGFGYPRRFRVELSDDGAFVSGVQSIVDRTDADQPNPGIQRQTFEAGGRSGRYLRVTATRLAPRRNDFIFALAELEAFDASGTNVARSAAVTASDSIEAPPRWAAKNLTDGKAPGTPPDPGRLAELRDERRLLLERRVPAEIREQLAATQRDLAEARRVLESMPAPQVVYAGGVHYGGGNFRGTGPDDGRPRPIFVLSRGDVTKPGKPAPPGTLACVDGLPSVFDLPEDAPEGARRAALARWLTDERNPLTWRSIVNRVWQHHFGRGLVETPNDFGRMGRRPTHPELLDWLAAEFRDGGQSFKSLHRLLVTSATYRQASRHDDARIRERVAEKDPENRLLSHMTVRRLEAEAVRDSILAVSGKLDTTMYGPAFQDFVVEKPEHSPHYQYHLHDPEDPRSHRRSVYRFLVRSQQEPFMTALDCADPSMRVDRRNETLTPLQALALLNSRLTVAMARHFAERVDREAGETREARVDRAFRLALQRGPTTDEAIALNDYTRDHGLPAACRLLLNLNEFVFVD